MVYCGARAQQSRNGRVPARTLLTGARREELAALRWDDLDFRWGSLLAQRQGGGRGPEGAANAIPAKPTIGMKNVLTKRLRDLESCAAGRKKPVDSSPSPSVFFSRSAANGRINEPRIPHRRALAVAGLDHVTLHGLRRTFASLAEWVEMPQGVAAQIMGHKPSATAERHYINRPLELLALWHGKYERWILGASWYPVQLGASRQRAGIACCRSDGVMTTKRPNDQIALPLP